MRHYRDKFVAHLDSERVMNIPNLDIAKKSTFYLVRVVTSEATPEELSGCEPYMDLSLYYNVSEDEAKQIYGTLDDS